MWLFLMFVVLPAIELALVIKIGGLIGALPTVGLMILSAMAGSLLMRRQGALALADLQRSFRDLRDPTAPLAHGALILLAGVLMVTPGFLTDLAGLALLVPGVRRAVLRLLARRIRVTRAGFGFPGGPGFPGGAGVSGGAPRGEAGSRAGASPPRSAPGPVIDADYSVLPQTQRGSPGSGWTRD